MLSHIGVLIICGTWLYVTSHKREGAIMYVVALVLWLLTVVPLTRGTI